MAQVDIVSGDTRKEAWTKDKANRADLQSNIDAKADTSAISNMDNTSDANKQVSDATVTALGLKVDVPTIQAAVPVTGDANGLYIAPVADGESRFYNKVTLGVYNLTDGGYTAF